MVFPTHKIAIISTLAKGFFQGFRDAELHHGNLEIDDNILIEKSIDEAVNFYNDNSAALENQGIYFFALPK